MSARASKTTKSSSSKGTKGKKRGNKSTAVEIDSSILHVEDDLLPQWMNRERTKVLTGPDVTQPKKINSDNDKGQRCVYYWMQRDLRTVDNWALLFAQHLAQSQNIPLRVLYVLPCPYTSTSAAIAGDNSNNSDSDDSDHDASSLPPKVCEMQMTERHGSFLLGGLKVVEEELRDKNVPLHILRPKSHSEVGQTVYDFVTTFSESSDSGDDDGNNGPGVASVVVCDMSPLRQYREWMEDQAAPLLRECSIPLYQVDAQ